MLSSYYFDQFASVARWTSLPQTVIALEAPLPMGLYYTSRAAMMVDSSTLKKLGDKPQLVCTILPPRWFD